MNAGAIVTDATMYRPTNSTAPHGPSVESCETTAAIHSLTIQKVPNLVRTRGRASGRPAAAAAALGKHVRQPLERFGRLLQPAVISIRIGPVGGIQPIGQRVQRFLSRGIRRPVRNALANDRMPVREKRNAFVRRCPFDRRGNRERGGGAAGRRAAGGSAAAAARRAARDATRERLLFAPRPPAPRLGRRFRSPAGSRERPSS